MKKLAISVLFTLVLFSCDTSDDTTTSIPENLVGKWELQSVSCFCFFPDEFDFAAHKIDFNSTGNTLNIENSEETSLIAATGNYDFQIQANKISIVDVGEYNFEVNGNTLVMSFEDNPELADDEIRLTYEKM